MASKQLNIVLAVFAIVLPAVAMANEFTLGDESGWTTNFDYQGWANDKVFRVGDKLVFKYTAGRHNVFKVNGTAFTNCNVPPPNEGLTSGNDVITLTSPGRKWYICGVADHCSRYGQKLAINVLAESAAPGPAPSFPMPSTPGSAIEAATPMAQAPSSAYNGMSVSGYQLLVAAMVSVAFLVVWSAFLREGL